MLHSWAKKKTKKAEQNEIKKVLRGFKYEILFFFKT